MAKRRSKGGNIQPLKSLKAIDPLRQILQNYHGPFSPTRQLFKTYRGKNQVSFEKGNYIIKTISTGTELEEVLKLRYSVFHREYRNKKFPFGIDIDQFDHLADHLVIVDKKKDKIVGTYRLISSTFSNTFYSQTEFHLDNFLREPGLKMELSRACIQKKYRTGVVMNLLWRGIAQLLVETGAKYLFGCTSIRTMELHETACVIKYLGEKNGLSSEYDISPLASYEMPGLKEYADKLEMSEKVKETAKGFIPALFQSYLRMGASAYGLPALDKDFRCVDFFTVLQVSKMAGLYERKYMS